MCVERDAAVPTKGIVLSKRFETAHWKEHTGKVEETCLESELIVGNRITLSVPRGPCNWVNDPTQEENWRGKTTSPKELDGLCIVRERGP